MGAVEAARAIEPLAHAVVHPRLPAEEWTTRSSCAATKVRQMLGSRYRR